MEITIRHTPGCPNVEPLRENTESALRALNIDADVVLYGVETIDDARRLAFAGSPTLLVDGEDPFASENETFGLACRVYQTSGGPAGSPTTGQLEAILDA